MANRKIGVMVESFRLGVRQGLVKAREVGADGVQVYVTGGDVSPEGLTESGRREFRKLLADNRLTLSAVCADYGKGFLDANRNDETVPKSKACVDLALELGTNIITTHIGRLPDDENDPRYRAAFDAVSDLADYAASRDAFFATETGPESPEHLRAFLEKVASPGIKVNYDPANFVMRDFDQLGGVEVLGPWIVHTHAKDGLRGQGKEVALGDGDVDFPEYLARLEAIGYDGFLTIEREVGPDPMADIVKAVKFLRSM